MLKDAFKMFDYQYLSIVTVKSSTHAQEDNFPTSPPTILTLDSFKFSGGASCLKGHCHSWNCPGDVLQGMLF